MNPTAVKVEIVCEKYPQDILYHIQCGGLQCTHAYQEGPFEFIGLLHSQEIGQLVFIPMAACEKAMKKIFEFVAPNENPRIKLGFTYAALLQEEAQIVPLQFNDLSLYLFTMARIFPRLEYLIKRGSLPA